MAGTNTPLCLVCYKPMRVLDCANVPKEAVREIACGLRLNAGCAEATGWLWCADCRYYSHLPTIVRLLEEYREMAQRADQDVRKGRR